MGESHLNGIRQPTRRFSLRVTLFTVLCAASLQVAAAEPLKLYLHKDRGMPVYTSLKPDNVEYTVVYPGSGAARPVLSLPPSDPEVDNPSPESGEVLVGWAASCKGVSKQTMDQRAVQWQDLMAQHAETYGVPVALVHAVIRVESCFDPRALSRVGARGLMQLMPKTAEHLGVTDSFDGGQNIAGGVRYLSQLLNRFENDTRLAVAAYNAGPSAVDAYGGIPPFSETRKYVERVLAEYRERSPAAAKKPKS